MSVIIDGSFSFRMEPDEQGRFGFNVQVSYYLLVLTVLRRQIFSLWFFSFVGWSWYRFTSDCVQDRTRNASEFEGFHSFCCTGNLLYLLHYCSQQNSYSFDTHLRSRWTVLLTGEGSGWMSTGFVPMLLVTNPPERTTSWSRVWDQMNQVQHFARFQCCHMKFFYIAAFCF